MAGEFPIANGPTYLTEAGIETYIDYKIGIPIPNFCLFDLLNDAVAEAAIKDYFRALLRVAEAHNRGFILCGLHYRASADWGALMGYSEAALAAVNRKGIVLYQQLAAEFPDTPTLISGCIGPKGDAYQLGKTLTAEAAHAYHLPQIQVLKEAGADLITGLTLNSVDEAIGITRAGQGAGIPVVISFTLDDTAQLQTGPSLKDAIAAVDAATQNGPAYYMLNCTHPDDFLPALEGGDWIKRLGGIRPNASALDKGVLCKLGHLEEGDPVELGRQMGDLARRFPHISVWGGCCGTDALHINEIAENVIAARGR